MARLRLRTSTLPTLTLTVALAWTSGTPDLRAGSAAPPSASDRAETSAAQAQDACTFIPKGELESLVGRELRAGVKKDVPPPMSQCSFQTPAGAYVTKKFENPALPSASGFDSLTVTTFATTVATFAESRKTMGAGSPEVPGAGDSAFFSGPAMIFARVGTRAFSIRVYLDEPKTDAGRARLRDLMLTLAQSGVAKLR